MECEPRENQSDDQEIARKKCWRMRPQSLKRCRGLQPSTEKGGARKHIPTGTAVIISGVFSDIKMYRFSEKNVCVSFFKDRAQDQ